MPELTETITISAPVDEVWELAGDPGRIAEWLPLLESSQLDGDRRDCTMKDGQKLVERITEHSEDGHSYSYEILDSPMPLRSYRSRFALEGHGGHTHVNWVAEFEPEAAEAEDELRTSFATAYREGLERLAELAEAR